MKIVEEFKKVPEADKKKAKGSFNLITKSLGILQEDGVFAFYVYLKSESNKGSEMSVIIEKETVELLKNVNSQLTANLEQIQLLAEDINTLLLAKTLLEKTLIYARYQVKSESD